MTFIEYLLGIAPDGGTGTTEALLFLTITAVVMLIARRRRPVQR
jgi:hypothetical protein